MSTEQLKTIVSKDTVLEGVLKSSGQIEVHGKVMGEIECESLVVYVGASVQGKVACGTAEIYGEVRTQGDFAVRGTLTVRGGAVVGGERRLLSFKKLHGFVTAIITDGFPGDLNGIPVLEA